MRRLIILVMTLLLVGLTGCGKIKEIKVNSAKVENIRPYGLRGADLGFVVEIDNPAIQIKLSDMQADVEYCGKVLGKVTVDPFTMKGRSVETYHLKAKMILDEGLSFYDMLMLLDKNFMEKCLVDITVKGKLRGGLSKTVTKNDVPLKKLVEYADKKK